PVKVRGDIMSTDQDSAKARLLELRASTDNLDAALIHVLAERFRCAMDVGKLKAQYNMPPADSVREQQQSARLRRLADEANLEPDFAEKILSFIAREVIRHHEAIAEQHTAPAGNTQA